MTIMRQDGLGGWFLNHAARATWALSEPARKAEKTRRRGSRFVDRLMPMASVVVYGGLPAQCWGRFIRQVSPEGGRPPALAIRHEVGSGDPWQASANQADGIAIVGGIPRGAAARARRMMPGLKETDCSPLWFGQLRAGEA